MFLQRPPFMSISNAWSPSIRLFSLDSKYKSKSDSLRTEISSLDSKFIASSAFSFLPTRNNEVIRIAEQTDIKMNFRTDNTLGP